MQDFKLIDDDGGEPNWQSMESVVARHRPRLAAPASRDLLYQCAFQAGRKFAQRTVRYWQLGCGSMAVLFVASLVLLHDGERPSSRPLISAEHEDSPIAPVLHMSGEYAPPIPAYFLAAWQANTNSVVSLENELAQLRQRSPADHALSVGRLSQSAVP
jgi:hypothetical protein